MKVNANEYIELIVNQVHNKIIQHTIQLWILKEGKIKPYGTGVFFSIKGIYFIFSAGHVLKYLEENEDEHLFIKIGTQFTNILGNISFLLHEESKLDFGYIMLDKQMENCLNEYYKSLKITDTSDLNTQMQVMNFGVLGYSEIDFLDKENPLSTFPTFYLTDLAKDNIYEHYRFDKNHFIITNFKGKGRYLNNGMSDTIIKMPSHFHGISGGGLWYFKIEPSGEVSYKLIGLMTEYRKSKFYCLISIKIGFILGLIHEKENIEIK